MKHIEQLLSHKYSVLRTVIFTMGHFCIDVTTNYLITGASIKLVAISAIISPLVNAVWYYLLDRCLFCYLIKKKNYKNNV